MGHALLCGLSAALAMGAPAEELSFEIRLETVLKHDDGKFLWYHPRVAAIPGAGKEGAPAVVMTLQRHLSVSDYYSGLYFMRSDDGGKTWSPPDLRPELDWRNEPGVRPPQAPPTLGGSGGAEARVTLAVADVTPGWHAPTGKVIALGAQVRYSPKGEQLEDTRRAHQTAYTVYDPKAGTWTPWRPLEMPADERFNYARNACAQWIVEPDGMLLVPLYMGRNAVEPFSVTVARCRFDGDQLTYVEHGDILELKEVRGLCEPSLARLGGRYFLTLRNDIRGYVTASDDGLHYAPIRPWTFDDGAELGSYNTQQHWLEHSDGLFLAYTRRGANNDHIMRHRAPLFMARVDPEKLQVIRSTERVLIPERGATMGNFGAAAISESESWVTVSEGVWSDDARKRGAEGATFVARVLWSRPNRLAPAR